MVRICTLFLSVFYVLTTFSQDNVLCHKYYISVFEDDVKITTYDNCLESGLGYDCAALNIKFPNSPIDSILIIYQSFHVTELEIHDFNTRKFPSVINEYSCLLNLDLYLKKVCDINSINISNLNSLVHFGFSSNAKYIPKDVFYLKNLKSLVASSNRNLTIEIPIDNLSLIEEFLTSAKMSKKNLSEVIKLKKLQRIIFTDVKKVKQHFQVLKNIKEVEIWGELSEDDQMELKKLLPQAVYKEWV